MVMMKLRTKKPVNKLNLEETGRLKIYFHCPESELPIRNVLNQKNGLKTEPHIEIGAENYWNCCYQKNNIKPFTKSNEKYLFLFTYCKNMKLSNVPRGPLITGYIVKRIVGEYTQKEEYRCGTSITNSHFYVQGDVFLYDFKDSITLEELGLKRVRFKPIGKDVTSKILDHFKDKEPINEAYIKEIKKLDPLNETCYRFKNNKICEFRKDCERWKEIR